MEIFARHLEISRREITSVTTLTAEADPICTPHPTILEVNAEYRLKFGSRLLQTCPRQMAAGIALPTVPRSS